MSNPLIEQIPIAGDLREFHVEALEVIRKHENGSLQPVTLSAFGQRWRAAWVKALIERCSRIEADNVDLKQQLYDEALAFNHANEIVGKLEAEVAQLKAERDQWKEKFESMRRINDADLESYNNCALQCRGLEAENLRLKAPVSQPEIEEFFHRDDWGVQCVYRSGFDALLTARTGGSNGK